MPRPLQPFGSRTQKGGVVKRTKGGPFAVGGSGARRWGQIATRLQVQAANNLGVIMSDQVGNQKARKFRNEDLEVYDQYYEGTQYDDLIPWEEALRESDYVQIRQRKPRVNYRVAKALVNKVAAKIIGTDVFPKFVVEEDPEDTEFLRTVMKACNFRASLVEPMKRMLNSGACLIQYRIVEGTPIIDWHNAKYCYPLFDAKNDLVQVEVKYVYEDPNDKDAQGKFKKKWYRLVLTQTSDILFDNPEYKPGSEPQFKVVEQVDHMLGWVQAEWFRTAKHKHDPDGDSLVEPITDFIDELNYSLSQTSQAVSYNQDPQTVFTGIENDELDKLIKSSQKGWNLGRETAKAELLEADMKGVETAGEQRNQFKNLMLDVVRVVLHDPEKMAANAQSGRAIELLHGPLMELLDELRTELEPLLIKLLLKIAMTLLIFDKRGEETILQVPANYTPKSLEVTAKWPAVFPLTLDDLQKKSQVCNVLATAKIVSRESLLHWVAPDIEVEDIDEELSKIAAEPDVNPFGSFGGP